MGNIQSTQIMKFCYHGPNNVNLGISHFPSEMHLVPQKRSTLGLNFISSHQELPSMNMNTFWQHNVKWKA